MVREALHNKRDSTGSCASAGVIDSRSGSVESMGSLDGLTPETRSIKEQGYCELMETWRIRRGLQGGLWAWRRQLQNSQVTRDMLNLGYDQWVLNQRLCYFLNFTEHQEAQKLRQKTKAQLAEADAEALHAAKQTPTKPPRGKPATPVKTPGTVAGRVKRDPRHAKVMTRAERLQADKKNRTGSSQSHTKPPVQTAPAKSPAKSPSKARKGPMQNLNGVRREAWT